jgi:hypothetical protein
MSACFVMDVGALALAVEDHDEFGGAVNGREGVRRHGGELGGLAGSTVISRSPSDKRVSG